MPTTDETAREIVKALKEMLPPKEDYAELVGAEGWAHGQHYVWTDPEPYHIKAAIDLIESLTAENAELREQLAIADGVSAKMTIVADTARRRERAAVGDLKVMALAMRESEELSEGCCFACAHDGQNLPDDAILIYGECPGYEADDCFEWRGPQEAWKGE